MTKDVIRAEKLTFGYANRVVIKDMTLNIDQGEFIGLLGQNGCGKSTFLKLLLGQLQPLSGALSLFDLLPAKGDGRIGYMPQIRSYQSIAHLTCFDLLRVTLNGVRMGWSPLKKNQKKLIIDMLSLVDALHLKSRCMNQLSGGEMKRIHLAQALLNQPTLLLLDEPLANLDYKMQERFVHLLKKIQQELNVTILITAHHPNALLSEMTRVLYFANNQAVIGKVDDIITTESLSKLYDTHIEVMRVKNKILIFGESADNESEDTHHYD